MRRAGAILVAMTGFAAMSSSSENTQPAGRAGPIATLTIATNSLAQHRLFFETGLGMTIQGPLPLDQGTRTSLAHLWQLPVGSRFDEYILRRPAVKDAARIRLLVLDRAGQPFRTSWEPTVLGPYTIGFPNTNQEALDGRLRALGFGARNPMERTPFTNPDGRSWDVIETVHTAPDFVAAVGIARGAGNDPISPVDERGLGGPAYSMMIVDDLDRMARFMRDVMGYEIRIRRLQASSGQKGAMRTPDGTVFELAQLYPPYGQHGFLILLQFQNVPVSPPAAPPRLPSTGLTLYSFPVDKLEPVLQRAALAGATQITGPVRVNNPPNGNTRHATFITPNGVMFELFEEPTP
jgi:catechol 2,3-dioxygenase-like lactoylglutathione lyase family enzyme